MTRFRLATVVLLLYLVSFAPSASAECAWVLWSSGMKKGTEQNPLSAFDSREQCEQEFKKTLENATRAGAVRRAEGKIITFSDGEQTAFICLPDTIDPRGPKGK
jgi:hypothetical protein